MQSGRVDLAIQRSDHHHLHENAISTTDNLPHNDTAETSVKMSVAGVDHDRKGKLQLLLLPRGNGRRVVAGAKETIGHKRDVLLGKKKCENKQESRCCGQTGELSVPVA